MTAGAVVVMMTFAAQQAVAIPAKAHGWHDLGWELPALQRAKSVPGRPGGLGDHPEKVASAPIPAVAWPGKATAEVELAPVAAGQRVSAAAVASVPVTLARGQGRDPKTGSLAADGKSSAVAHGPGRVKIEALDQPTSERVGIAGTLIRLAPVSGDTAGPLAVDLDYHSFAGAYGADYGSRLRFVEYPECVLTRPEDAQCRVKKPVESANDARSRHLIGQVAFAQDNMARLVAAEADDKGGGGDFKATSLKPAGSWSSGGSTGAFTYSYPVTTPAGPSGTAPTISLNYSSDAVDGLTSATNNQASAIGDGWSLSGGGFIERSYKSCSQDLGGNNGQTKKGDLCWFSDNATLSFAGGNDALVKDKGNGSWHSKKDTASKIERVLGASNGAKDGEYWKLTTADGTQYFFGLNHLPGWQSGKPETRSTWTEPVFGNNDGEPCHTNDFVTSSCQQAWRWNLDYSVDTHGNATAYYYDIESNAYALDENTASATSYMRGGYLSRIEYGFNTRVADVYSAAPARIVFDSAERCLPQGVITCDPGQLTKDNAKSWPDVPYDHICAEKAKCLYASPTFFSRKRYVKISTQVSGGNGSWNTVNEWSLGQSFPATGDGGSPSMWLDTITQTGRAGDPVTLPPTTFHPKAKANRVDANSQYTALTRNRIDAVTNSTGGVTAINYADPECKPGIAMPASPESNTLACYPAYWTPGGATDPVLDWFNKYPVVDITDDGKTQLSQQVLTHYDYLGGAAWHHDDNPLTDPKYRTWSQFRGYGIVKTTKGQAKSDPSGPPTVTENRYLRGMDGDAQPNGGHRSVTVPTYWGDNVADSNQFAGFARESLTYLDGEVVAETVNDPWSSAPTATDTDGFQAFYTGTAAARGRVWIASAKKWRVSRKSTTFGDYGLAVAEENDGEVNDAVPDPAQATCTKTEYHANTGVWLLNAVHRVTKFGGTCDAAPSDRNIIADTKNSFDQQDYAAVPTIGDVTAVDELDGWPPGGAEVFQSPAKKTAYDLYGRSVSVTDPRGLTTTTVYTPATGGPVTQIATTTPRISETNATQFTSTKVLDAVSGATLAEIDNSGLRTDAAYDALGRLTAVWTPGHDRSADASATTLYEYSVVSTGISSVTTKTAQADGSYAVTYALVDGLGRTVQTQSPTPYDGGGRVVADTYYDSQGRAYLTHSPYWNGDSGPAITLLIVQHNAVPGSKATTYDSAGRSVAVAYLHNGAEQWRTTTKYDGDRVTTMPPAGGVATAAITNGLGQKTQLLQFKDSTHTEPGDPSDVTSYSYTRAGQLDTVTDATGKNKWTTTYDLHWRKAASTDPDTGTTTYTYDPIGNLTTTTDARHRTLAYTYDNLGRKTAELDGSPSGPKLAEWTYDTMQAGLPTGSTRYADGRAYTTSVTGYDTAGRVTSTRITIPGAETGLGGTYDFTTDYDPLSGAVRSTTSPQKGGLSYERIFHDYGALGQPTGLHASAVGGPNTNLVSLTQYNALAQVLRTNFQDPNSPYQVSVTNTYEDGTNRLSGTIAQRATSANHDVTNRAYTYRPDDNLTQIADTPQDATPDIQCFRYDYLQRLSDAWTPSQADCGPGPAANALGGSAPYWTSWSFDTSGNRTRQVQHTAAGDTGATSTYPDPGQPRPHAAQTVTTASGSTSKQSGYTYNDAGSVATRGPAGGAQTFDYDAEGRLSSVTEADGKTSTYVYDADGNRLITRDPKGLTLTVGDLELHVAAGSSTAVGTRFYSYDKRPIAERNALTGLTWLLVDKQGTAYATVDAANLAVRKRWQDPYGVPRGPLDSTWPDSRGFLGGYQNTTGLTHLGAREYDPAAGAFTAADPVLDTDNPAHLNAYTYGYGNPIGNPDPSGLEPMLSSCANADDRLACANYGYTGSTGSDSFYNDYRMSWAWNCNWNRYCLAKNSDVTRKNSARPTRERAESVYREYHREAMTPRQVLQLGWELTGIPGILDCVKSPEWSSCLSAAADVALMAAPYLKGGKALKDIAKLEKLRDGARVGHTVDDAVAGEADVAAISKLGCPTEPHSFTPDTPVLMADGSAKPIKDVKVGDKVLNADPDSKVMRQHVVTAVHVTDDDHDLVDLVLDGAIGAQALTTTEHHPFWEARTHHWIEAGELRAGDRLVAPSQKYVGVLDVQRRAGRSRTYDLTVDGVHTYYVLAGAVPVLVHNTNCFSTTAGEAVKFLKPTQKTRTWEQEAALEHLSNEDLLKAIHEPADGDEILVLRDGRQLGGHHRIDELRRRVEDGRIDPNTPLHLKWYDSDAHG
ncbi:polymorphic toxin-type HINT domain-containing protein [Amycolatopsis sp. NPDC059027]|uniref:polymorphic toxin-type HINT domain-containing protein n=1 Tax=Amycolatopsis sp. NPDC059027 TaxID=3346709 RepID=UPI00366CB836